MLLHDGAFILSVFHHTESYRLPFVARHLLTLFIGITSVDIDVGIDSKYYTVESGLLLFQWKVELIIRSRRVLYRTTFTLGALSVPYFYLSYRYVKPYQVGYRTCVNKRVKESGIEL